jgi:hypothetical protein
MDEAALYVLAAPIPGTRTPAYLLYQVGGLDCVLAYTDLEHLVECCGDYQPWLGIQVGALMADLRDQQLPGPAINMPLGEAVRWTAAGPPREPGRLAPPAAGEGAAAVSAADLDAAENLPSDQTEDTAAGPARDGFTEPGEAPDADPEITAGRAAAAVPETMAGPGEVIPAKRKEWWQ